MRWEGFGGRYSPLNSFRRAEIVAYQQTYLAHNLAELGPGYECGIQCNRPEKTALSGCPACKLTTIQDGYRRLVDEAIAKGQPEDQDGDEWPVEDIQRDVNQVRSLLSERKDKISKRWPPRVAHLARVVLAAERKAVSNIKWRMIKDMEARARSSR